MSVQKLTEAGPWVQAGEIARMLMGKRKGPGRNSYEYWIADEDPLAWWCATELIMNFARRHRAAARAALKEEEKP